MISIRNILERGAKWPDSVRLKELHDTWGKWADKTFPHSSSNGLEKCIDFGVTIPMESSGIGFGIGDKVSD